MAVAAALVVIACTANLTDAARLKTHSYRGNGTVLLAPVTLPHGANVRWVASGGIFMLIALKHPASTGPNPQLIVSQARSGRGYLPAGKYRFKVGAFGAWQLRLVER